MTDSLTAMISKMQALLLDSGTVFSTATCTAAVREALARVNLRMPINAGTLVDAVADQLEYALSDPDFSGLLSVVGVWRWQEDEEDEALVYDAYFEDNAPFIRLREAEAAGETLVVRYTLPHTVNGLDGATESTLDGSQDATLIDGACAIAIRARLAARVETINLAPGVVENYQLAMRHFEEAFLMGLDFYARRAAGVGAVVTRAWDDEWHTWM